jgi:hypothetical protein
MPPALVESQPSTMLHHEPETISCPTKGKKRAPRKLPNPNSTSTVSMDIRSENGECAIQMSDVDLYLSSTTVTTFHHSFDSLSTLAVRTSQMPVTSDVPKGSGRKHSATEDAVAQTCKKSKNKQVKSGEVVANHNVNHTNPASSTTSILQRNDQGKKVTVNNIDVSHSSMVSHSPFLGLASLTFL